MKMMILLVALIIILIGSSASACTVFSASDGDITLGGNNEDASEYESSIWFDPPEEGKYGVVYVGYTHIGTAQGGMNDQGLFMDYLAAPYLEVINSADKPRFSGVLFNYILETCSTVEEALEIVNIYNLQFMSHVQVLLADSTGVSVIVEGDDIIPKEEYYQVCTNFYQSHPELGGYPCWRYETAMEMFENNNEASVGFFRSVLDAVHQGGTSSTQYSTIYDLKQKLVYLYYYHNYNNVIVFNLSEEFEQGYHSYSIQELFNNLSNRPNKPGKPSGSTSGEAGVEYTYTATATDPDGDQIYYLFDWSDDTDSGWIGPFDSGEECSASHIWNNKGDYEIKVRTHDIHGSTSDWSDPLPISMPKNNLLTSTFFLRLFQRFSSLFLMLKYILGFS